LVELRTSFAVETNFMTQEVFSMAKGYKTPKMPGGKGGGMGGGMGGGGMMGQLQKLQQQMAEAQEKLADETTEYTAGGGAIKIVITGDQVCRSITIDPDLLKDMAAGGDADMLQDLLLTAFNGALDASRKLAENRLGPLAGGLPF
jgi:nucleoid-associated protein EbfC